MQSHFRHHVLCGVYNGRTQRKYFLVGGGEKVEMVFFFKKFTCDKDKEECEIQGEISLELSKLNNNSRRGFRLILSSVRLGKIILKTNKFYNVKPVCLGGWPTSRSKNIPWWRQYRYPILANNLRQLCYIVTISYTNKIYYF